MFSERSACTSRRSAEIVASCASSCRRLETVVNILNIYIVSCTADFSVCASSLPRRSGHHLGAGV